MQQSTNTIVMVRPATFRANEQTAANNFYQKKVANTLSKALLKQAQKEFDDFVKNLTQVGVQVIVVPGATDVDTPDAHFPNNWISFHEDGTVALYPMFAPNRRLERNEKVLEEVENHGFKINNIIDYTEAEKDNVFLEGTGSMVLDRVHKKAYCALSERADEDLFIEFCEDFEYTPVIFKANQTVNGKRLPIYHTNVMMAVADKFAIVCLDSIDDKKERKNLIKHLNQDGKEIIPITESQTANFAGNMLQVLGAENKSYLVMSTSAFNSLTTNQKKSIEKYSTIIHSDLATIEACGGGSARCMMAEVFLPKG